MTPVTIMGMAAGAVLILTAVVIFLSKKDFPPGGIVVTLVAFAFIGMSQWSSIKITAAGATLEAIRGEVRQTAAAADEVAAQAQQAAAAVRATKEQLESLTVQLDKKQVLSPAATEPIRAQLRAAPTVDVSKLNTARATLNRVKGSATISR